MQGIADALARVVSGCYVLTLPERDDQGDVAILLSFIQQVGFEPPRIIAAIRKGRSAVDAVESAGTFVLNVCGEDRVLLKRFASGTTRSQSAFSGMSIERLPEGVVLRDSAAWLVCRVAGRFDGGDHWIYLADVLRGGVLADRLAYVHSRKTGLAY